MAGTSAKTSSALEIVNITPRQWLFCRLHTSVFSSGKVNSEQRHTFVPPEKPTDRGPCWPLSGESFRRQTSDDANDGVVSVAEVKALKKRIRQLERVLGNKTLEVEILKEAVRIGREKNSSRGCPYPAWRISSEKDHGRSAVSRSNTYERSRSPRPRPERYSKAEDAYLLPLIVELLGGRQTYGYRRTQRLLNRQLIAGGRTPVNHKRVYRIMRQNNLLLARFTGSRSDKAHTGKVSTLQRNQRWCSDGFEIACDNGERVRVIFALDTCDWEVMANAATTGGYSADMAQSVMLACVEKRFRDVKTLQPVEWLSDNGSCYTARETITFAAALGIVSIYFSSQPPKQRYG